MARGAHGVKTSACGLGTRVLLRRHSTITVPYHTIPYNTPHETMSTHLASHVPGRGGAAEGRRIERRLRRALLRLYRGHHTAHGTSTPLAIPAPHVTALSCLLATCSCHTCSRDENREPNGPPTTRTCTCGLGSLKKNLRNTRDTACMEDLSFPWSSSSHSAW